jgi:C-terminal processing protease CtpA/Prc
LIVGDIIVGLAGEAVSDHDELLAQMQGDVVGKATDVEVLRGGKPHTLKVTMGEAPQSEERHGKHHRGGGRHGRHGQRGWGRGR